MSAGPTSTTDTEIYWLKPQQVEAMRDAAHHGRHGPRDDAIITILYDTGLRRGELAQVTRGMLDLEDEHLRIPPGIQKDYPNENTPNPATFELDQSGRLRTVRTLRNYLAHRDDTDEALFRSQKGGGLTGKAINSAVQRAAHEAEVQPTGYTGPGRPADVSAHTLRHSVAWRMLRAEDGNTLYDVRNRLRHASILTTERNYDHFETI
jgi:integrase